ncbi:hypothetical protein OIU76_026689 [Salix suchowensis]|nr:hypothetical protein OIU76_026689 [Salix suchowensis]
MVSATPRSISLPHETNSSEATKVFTRAASFQPDRTGPARHVHPKLPDYDDLAARFAALKGRCCGSQWRNIFLTLAFT